MAACGGALRCLEGLVWLDLLGLGWGWSDFPGLGGRDGLDGQRWTVLRGRWLVVGAVSVAG
jgi:hypothetical protein